MHPDQGLTTRPARSFATPDLKVQPDLEPSLQLAAGRFVPAKSGVAEFLQRQGGEWELRWDRRSDRPNLIQGSGVPLLPGKGNTLTSAALGLAANATIDLATVETRLRDFIAANESLLRARGLEFRLDPDASTSYGPGDTHWFVEFAQYADGIRVKDADLFFRIAQGNIVQFGSNQVAPVEIDAQPVSSAANALQLALREMDFPAGTGVREVLDPGELLFLPVAPNGSNPYETYLGKTGEGYAHRLAWRFVFRVDGDASTYEVLLDAKSNRVLESNDLNDYVNATVSGGIYPITNSNPETVVPFPYAAVTNSVAKITDALGIYDYAGGTATTALDGKYFRMADNCGSVSLSSTTDGNLNLGTSAGTDCTTPGFGGAGNTHSSRTGFYHLTKINEKARSILPTNPWLQTKVTANMNINARCNAYWDGSTLNFYKSGAPCSNTGEIAGVFLHEWGHGLDTNTGGTPSGDQGSGEAVGDTFAFLYLRDGCIGENFTPGTVCDNCTTCTGVRDVNDFSSRGTRTIASPANVTSDSGINCDSYIGLGGVACPYNRPDNGQAYRGLMGYEGHCESYISSSANWDLTQALVDKFGADDGYAAMDRIWYGSLTPSKSAYRLVSGGQCNPAAQVDGCGANNWYTVYLAADDDDGNLANGTPNGCRIWDAFNAHGIACGARPVCSADAPDFALTVSNPSQAVCAPATASYTISVAAQMNFTNPVTLSASGLPAGVSANFSPNPVTPGSNATLTLNVGGSAAAGASTITVNGSATDSPGHSIPVQLNVTTAPPGAATPTTPASGATGVTTAPTLSWTASADAASYTLEIATDPGFATLVQSVPGLTVTSYAVSGLQPLTTYYWRVKALNACGSTTSTSASFTTANMICRAPHVAIPDNNATGVTDSITLDDTSTLSGLRLAIKATHTYVGDLTFVLSKGSSNVTVIRRPTNGAGTCSRADVDVTLDDAATTPVQSQCNSTPPALSGTLKPNTPMNTVFNGQSLAGTWSLKAIDGSSQDTGKLEEWCLIPITQAPPSYTVGGSVSGLDGSGLVLSLNGGAQTLPVAANGAFTFATGLASGAAYAVTVGTQPSGQTCSIANGSGTIGSANVTNIAVTCAATSAYTVGGNVSGLSGSGLVLSLNGAAQTLPIAANGAFAFPSGLATGATYAVTVGTQPSGQTCSVANGNGTIGSADVTDVAVTCAANPTYTVGGNVSGLAGSGLVLSLNGAAQILPIAANGAFAFPSGLANGVAYAVTVGTQPSGQTCNVANGSGTIGSADVTDVAVTCAANAAYSVGGSVSGLLEGSLVLKLNDGSGLTIGANGPFAFPEHLASGADYAVTIATQPAGHGCTVANGSGVIAAADVTNVAVTCSNDRIFADGFEQSATPRK